METMRNHPLLVHGLFTSASLLLFTSMGIASNSFPAERFIVSVTPGHSIPDLITKHGQPLTNSNRYWLVDCASELNLTEMHKVLAEEPGVYRVERDQWVKRNTSQLFDDPLYGSQWYHRSIDSEILLTRTTGDPKVRVAVIDSGIETTHPELSTAVIAPRDVFAGDDDPNPEPGFYCRDDPEDICDEHGTAVAGVIVARANNAEGIVGFCPQCSLIPIRLLGDVFSPISADIAAFEHAIENDAWVINNSWGYAESMPVSDTVKEVIERAATEPRDGLGAVIIFAAGNESRSIQDYELTALPDVLSVTATDQFGNPTPYTNSGASVDLAAPAATVTTSVNGGYTSQFGGTSAAAPVVAGIASLILSEAPSLSSAQVRELLVTTARKDPRVRYDDDGHNATYGFGLLDVKAIVERLDAPEESSGASGCQSSADAPWWLFSTVLFVAVSRRRNPNALKA